MGDDGIGLGDGRDRLEGWGKRDYVGDIGKKNSGKGGGVRGHQKNARA